MPGVPKPKHVTIDQNTVVNIVVVISIVGSMTYGAYKAAEIQTEVGKLVAVGIERRLVEIETTLKFMSRKATADELRTRWPANAETAPRLPRQSGFQPQ